MKRSNKYDLFIEKLALEFTKIPNFHLTQEDAQGKRLFNFVVKRFTEINSFKNLFTKYYLPAASKSIVDDLKEINKSKYKHLIVITKEDLKENYYETIRLGYIGMFHKYENYLDDLIEQSEFLISDIVIKGTPLSQYAEVNFQFKIKDWRNSPTIKRLNWICICNKHYDGYPRKEPVPSPYSQLPKDKKIKLSRDQFKRDIELLISHYNSMLQIVMVLGLHKMTFENESFQSVDNTDDELKQQMIEVKSKMDNNVHKLIDLLRSE